MSTSDFFKQVIAHTQIETSQPSPQGSALQRQTSPVTQAVLDAIHKRQHLLCKLPLQAHSPSLYTLPALMSQGMAIIVSPDHGAILRNIEFFKQNGFSYPDICYLDEEQMPHDWRDIEQQASNHRVKILLTTPDTFDTLNFIDLVVHNTISFIGIEQADRFYRPLQSRFRYDRLKDALSRFRRKPPLALFLPSIPEPLIQIIGQTLDISQDHQLLVQPSRIDTLQIRVHRVLSTHQKVKRLIDILLQPSDLKQSLSEHGLSGRVFTPGSALVRVRDIKTAEFLKKALVQYGFDPVHTWHPNLKPEERRQLERAFSQEENQLIIAVDEGHRYLKGPEGSTIKLIDWQPPKSMDALFISWLRISAPKEHPHEHAVSAHLLYCRDDLEPVGTPPTLSTSKRFSPTPEAKQSYQRLLQWLDSTECRKQSFLELLEPHTDWEEPKCGVCDRCQERGNVWKQRLRSVTNIWRNLKP